MAPRYLANPFEEEVLSALDAFDPNKPRALVNPLLTIDARGQAAAFEVRLGPTLVAALSDKIRNLEVKFVGGLGTHGREFAMDVLRERRSRLDNPTRLRAKEALANWRSLRAERQVCEGETDYTSGIGILMPVSGALLHYDIALAMQFD